MKDTHQGDSQALFLGYDDSCARCSGTAQAVREVVGDKLEVVPLSSPAMREWRNTYLSPTPPWMPTLVRPGGDTPNAWTGWSMAPVLLKALGRSKTMKVINVIGARELQRAGKAPSGTSRRQFMAGVAGAIAGLGMLLGTRTVPAHAQPTAPPDTDASDLEGSERDNAAMRHLAGRDIKVLTSRSSRARVAVESAAATTAGSTLLEEYNESDTEFGFGPAKTSGALQVSVAETDDFKQKEQGSRSVALIYSHSHETAFLSIHEYLHDDTLQSEAREIRVGTTASGKQTVKDGAYSFNGAEAIPLTEDAVAAGFDPCGACNCGPGGSVTPRRTHSSCTASNVLVCIGGIVGCGSCVSRCRTLACIACFIAACPAALAACCNENVSYCVVCSYCA